MRIFYIAILVYMILPLIFSLTVAKRLNIQYCVMQKAEVWGIFFRMHTKKIAYIEKSEFLEKNYIRC